MSSDLDFFDLAAKETPRGDVDSELDLIFGTPSTKPTAKPQPSQKASVKAAEETEEDVWGPGLKEAGPPPESPVVHMSADEKVSAPTSFTIDLANFPSMRKFLLRPLPKGLVFQTVITRQKTGFLGKYPIFELHTDDTMGQWSNKFLLCAKRQAGNKTPNYHISMDRVNFDPPSKSYVGKLRSNFLGTEHVIYDDGFSPEKEGVSEQEIRLELGVVLYSSNMASNQPRDMTVVLPDPSADRLGSTNILARYSATSTQGLTVLQQLKPRYNDNTKTYNLNFHGRVKVPSVKNFILVGANKVEGTQTDETEEALLFGKINANDQFHMDVRWPLSPLQAFAICVSCFE